MRRQLAPRLIGRRVTAAWGDARSPRIGDLAGAVGATVLGLERRGKYLVAPLGPGGRPARRRPARAPGDDRRVPLPWPGRLGARPLRPRDVRPGRPRRRDRRAGLPRRPTLRDAGRHAARRPRRAHDAGQARARSRSRTRSRPRRSTRRCGARPRPSRPRCCPSATSPASATSTPTRRSGAPGSTPRPAPLSRARSDRLWAAIREVLAEAITREGTTFRDYRMVNGGSPAATPTSSTPTARPADPAPAADAPSSRPSSPAAARRGAAPASAADGQMPPRVRTSSMRP